MKLDHVAVAVRDLERAIDALARLGLTLERTEDVATEGARVAFFPVGGGAHLELVCPVDPGSAIARSIEKRGEGLHHLCFEVEDVDDRIRALTAQGVQLVKEVASPGAGGSRVVFVHPKSAGGVLVELVEKPRSPC